MTDNSDTNLASGKRERSPSFPYLDLETSITHLRLLYEVAKKNEVRMNNVSEAWGMSPTSGSFVRYVAALKQYGLIEIHGVGLQRRIKVSERGLRILEDGRPGTRETLMSEAALKPKLIRGIYFGEDDMPHWGDDRPSDSIAESTLQFDLNFGAEAAKRFLSVYDETIKCIHKSDEPEKDESSERNADEDDIDTVRQTESQQTPVRRPNDSTRDAKVEAQTAPSIAEPELNEIMFKSNPGGTVTISAKLDAEGLDLLEKKIQGLRMLMS